MVKNILLWFGAYLIFQRITYVNSLNKKDYTVRVILCDPNRAWNLEKALIDKHSFNLRDNTQKYRLYFQENEKEIQAVKEEYEATEAVTPVYDDIDWDSPDAPF